MIKQERYRYLGKNGIITTAVELLGVEPILMYYIEADEGKLLTDGERTVKQTEIFAEDLEKWKEIDDGQ